MQGVLIYNPKCLFSLRFLRQKAIEAMIKGDDETAKRKTAKEMGVSGERVSH